MLVTNWACGPVWGWGSLSEIKLVASAAEIYFKFRLLIQEETGDFFVDLQKVREFSPTLFCFSDARAF